jgi:hypothetical protein
MKVANRGGAAPQWVVGRWLGRRPGVGVVAALLMVAVIACGGGASAAAPAAGAPSAKPGQPGALATGAAATRTPAAQTQATAATQTRVTQGATTTQAQAAATQTRAAQGQVATSGQGPAAAATQTRAAQLQAVGLPASGPAPPSVTPTLSAQVQALRACYYAEGQNQGVPLKDDCISAQARAQAARDCQEFTDAAGCANQWARYVQAALDHQLRMPAQLCLAPGGVGSMGGYPSPDTKSGDPCDTGRGAGRVAAVVRN